MKNNLLDKDYTYEQLFPQIKNIMSSVGCAISENTEKNLLVVLKLMGYIDHQYDNKNVDEQHVYYQQITEKLENVSAVDMGEMDEHFTTLAEILEKTGRKNEFLFYVNKILLHNNLACTTHSNREFIKHKYLEGYVSTKIITTFLHEEGLSQEADKLLCNIAAIANILDDFLDISDDYKNGVSEINPSIKLKILLLSNVFYHTIQKFVCSKEMNVSIAKNIAICVKNHLKKKFI